jgi:hypothetical protein
MKKWILAFGLTCLIGCAGADSGTDEFVSTAEAKSQDELVATGKKFVLSQAESLDQIGYTIPNFGSQSLALMSRTSQDYSSDQYYEMACRYTTDYTTGTFSQVCTCPGGGKLTIIYPTETHSTEDEDGVSSRPEENVYRYQNCTLRSCGENITVDGEITQRVVYSTSYQGYLDEDGHTYHFDDTFNDAGSFYTESACSGIKLNGYSVGIISESTRSQHYVGSNNYDDSGTIIEVNQETRDFSIETCFNGEALAYSSYQQLKDDVDPENVCESSSFWNY